MLVVAVGLKSDSVAEIKENLIELENLVGALDGEVAGSFVQMLPAFNPATLMGSGKVSELATVVQESKAQYVILDRELSGIQTRNLEQAFGVKVLDRTQLILAIFADRARTFEGKLQVELALLMDQMPRMVDAWMGSLSRQGGGVGTRGPGETALENDRRRIKERIAQIRKKLESVRKNRAQHRNSRRRNEIPSFALVGYTNSGKSSLLNRLTGAQVLIKNQVFATLDPTTRKVFLPGSLPAVVTDTVGFIRHLPEQLIEAFKATLEESSEADILLHVIDLSSPTMNRQVEVVDQLIQDFGWSEKKIIYVYNKKDAAPVERQFQVKKFPRVFVSALTGQGIEQLKEMMGEAVSETQTEVQLFFGKSAEHKIFELSREARITKQESATQGTICYAQLTPGLMHRWREFLVR